MKISCYTVERLQIYSKKERKNSYSKLLCNICDGMKKELNLIVIIFFTKAEYLHLDRKTLRSFTIPWVWLRAFFKALSTGSHQEEWIYATSISQVKTMEFSD